MSDKKYQPAYSSHICPSCFTRFRITPPTDAARCYVCGIQLHSTEVAIEFGYERRHEIESWAPQPLRHDRQPHRPNRRARS